MVFDPNDRIKPDTCDIEIEFLLPIIEISPVFYNFFQERASQPKLWSICKTLCNSSVANEVAYFVE